MKEYKKGVDYYTKGIIRLEIYFPEDNTVCRWCQFSSSYDGTWKCQLTGEKIPYPSEMLGMKCLVRDLEIVRREGEQRCLTQRNT